MEKLTQLGHRVERPPENNFAGAVQLIEFDREKKITIGGSDPRADGHAYIS